MKLDASLLPEGYSTSKKDGIYAEFHENGQLAHVGLYDNGVPRAGSWQLFIDADAKRARAEQRLEMSHPSSSGDAKGIAPADAQDLASWLRERIEQIRLCAEKTEQRCSFCQRGLSTLYKLIAGPGVAICDGCVQLCWNILEEAKPRKKRWWPW